MQTITLYIGLDVHKDSIAIAIAEPGPKGEIRLFGTVTNDLGRLEQALGRSRACDARPERRGADDVEMQTGCAIPRPLQAGYAWPTPLCLCKCRNRPHSINNHSGTTNAGCEITRSTMCAAEAGRKCWAKRLPAMRASRTAKVTQSSRRGIGSVSSERGIKKTTASAKRIPPR